MCTLLPHIIVFSYDYVKYLTWSLRMESRLKQRLRCIFPQLKEIPPPIKLGLHSIGNVYKEDVNFPNYSQTPLIFPIPWAPAPFPKRGCESPAICCYIGHWFKYLKINMTDLDKQSGSIFGLVKYFNKENEWKIC